MKPEQKLVLRKYNYLQREKLCAYMEKMAENGWLLCNTSPLFWEFTRIAPQKLHFSVIYVAAGSEYSDRMNAEVAEFREYCEHGGWTLAAADGYHHFYWCDKEECTPLETDANLELQGIHDAGRRQILLPLRLSVISLCIALGSMAINFFDNWIDALSSTWFFLSVICVAVGVLFGLESYIRYHVWLKKARNRIENGETNPGDGPALPERYCSMVLQMFAAPCNVAYMVDKIGEPAESHFWICFGIGIGIPLLIFLCAFLWVWMLYRHFRYRSARRNKIGTGIVIAVLGLLFAGGMIFALRYAGRERNSNRIKYDYHGNMQIAYNDSLMFSVERFADGELTDYSSELRGKGASPILSYEIGVQYPRAGKSVPHFSYTFLQDRTGCLHGALFSYLKRRLAGGRGYNEDGSTGSTGCTVETVEAPAWGAKAVYRLFDCGEPTQQYLVDFGDRFLEIEYDEELTGEQIAIIRDIVMQN